MTQRGTLKSILHLTTRNCKYSILKKEYNKKTIKVSLGKRSCFSVLAVFFTAEHQPLLCSGEMKANFCDNV